MRYHWWQSVSGREAGCREVECRFSFEQEVTASIFHVIECYSTALRETLASGVKVLSASSVGSVLNILIQSPVHIKADHVGTIQAATVLDLANPDELFELVFKEAQTDLLSFAFTIDGFESHKYG